MMKPLVYLPIAAAVAFGASQVAGSLQDYSTTTYASTTDMLIAEKADPSENKRAWPPQRGYAEEIAGRRSTLARQIIKETPDDVAAALCDSSSRRRILGYFNQYIGLKMRAIRYPLLAAGEQEAREAESAWETSATLEAEARIVEVLKSGLVPVYELSEGNFGEARRLLGSFNPTLRRCP